MGNAVGLPGGEGVRAGEIVQSLGVVKPVLLTQGYQGLGGGAENRGLQGRVSGDKLPAEAEGAGEPVRGLGEEFRVEGAGGGGEGRGLARIKRAEKRKWKGFFIGRDLLEQK